MLLKLNNIIVIFEFLFKSITIKHLLFVISKYLILFKYSSYQIFSVLQRRPNNFPKRFKSICCRFLNISHNHYNTNLDCYQFSLPPDAPILSEIFPDPSKHNRCLAPAIFLALMPYSRSLWRKPCPYVASPFSIHKFWFEEAQNGKYTRKGPFFYKYIQLEWIQEDFYPSHK